METILRAPRRAEETTAAPAISRRGFLAAAVLGVATLVGLACVLGVDFVDDAYIFLRYARNMAQGHGAVFNVGERVEGFSSPLWTLLLASCGTVVPRFEILAYVLGLSCGAGVLILMLHGMRCRAFVLAWPDTAVLLLGLASCPALVFWCGSGMDTALFVLLVTAVLVSALADRRGAGLSLRTMVLLILATLARMESVLLAGYVGLVFAYERRSIRVLTGYALAVAALLLVRYVYYGAWVPNTYYAKVTAGLAQRLNDGVVYLLPAMRANVGLIAATLVVLLDARRRRCHARIPILLLGGWIVLWSAYVVYVGGDNFALFRFLLPVVPALFLLLAYGWAAVRQGWSPVARRVGLAGLVAVLAVSNILTYRAQARGYYGDVRLVRAWERVGRWLDRETPPDTVIATIVPGALGYFGRRRTIDMLGLTDRNVGLHGSVFKEGGHGHTRYHTDYIFQRRPDIVVYHSSGRFKRPVYADPDNIRLRSGFALYDFVTDPRCAQRYDYATVRLHDGTLVEMLKKRPVVTAIRSNPGAPRRPTSKP